MNHVADVRRVDRFTVILHAAPTITNEEWAEHLATMASWGRPAQDGLMVIWSDGELSAHQRRMTAESAGRTEAEYGPLAPFTLLFTNNVATRGVITALNWLMRTKTKAFPKSEMERALAKQGASAAEIATLKRTLAEMERGLGVAPSFPDV